MADEAVYLITHKDIPFDIHGANGGAEMAAIALARYLARAGKKVYFAAQLTTEEQEKDGVVFWSLGQDYNITRTLERIREIGPYHLIAACRAHSILESRCDPLCLSRIFMSHDQHGNDAGVSLRVVSHIADFLVCVSEAHADEFRKAGVDEDKLRVIHNGVDHSVFTSARPKLRDFNKLVFAGALVQDKGVHLLIQSFVNLKTKYPQLTLDIYGSASLWNREPYINEKEIQQHVPGIVFHGKKPQNDIAAAFRRAGICVVPSIWFEAFPLTAIEAQVTGCPVVAFAVGGLKEAVRHESTGLLLEEISENALTRALDSLLSAPQKLAEYSEEALRSLRPYYNWQRVADSVVELAAQASAASPKDPAAAQAVQAQPARASVDKPSFSVLLLSNTSTQSAGARDFADRLSRSLITQGIQAVHEQHTAANPSDFDLVHLLHSADIDWVRSEIANVRQAGIPLVLSLHTGEQRLGMPTVDAFASLLTEYVQRGQDKNWYAQQPQISDAAPESKPFFLDATAQYARKVIAYGAADSSALRFAPAFSEKTAAVRLGFNTHTAGHADEFEKRYGIKNFVLCAAPLQPAFNQLLLLKALESSELSLVIAAGAADSSQEYVEAVRSFERVGETVVIEALSDDIRAHAFAAARVHASTSWLEPPAAPSLEAAYHGACVVLSRDNCTAPLLGGKVFYCNPGNEVSIKNAVEAAYHSPASLELPNLAAEHPWQKTVAETIMVYRSILNS